MLRQTGTGFVVPHQLLSIGPHLEGKTGFQTVLHGVSAANGEAFRTVPPIAAVRGREGALGHGKVIDGVQQIGLPRPVAAADAVHIGAEGDFLELDVPEILDNYFFEDGHGSRVSIANIHFFC